MSPIPTTKRKSLVLFASHNTQSQQFLTHDGIQWNEKTTYDDEKQKDKKNKETRKQQLEYATTARWSTRDLWEAPTYRKTRESCAVFCFPVFVFFHKLFSSLCSRENTNGDSGHQKLGLHARCTCCCCQNSFCVVKTQPQALGFHQPFEDLPDLAYPLIWSHTSKKNRSFTCCLSKAAQLKWEQWWLHQCSLPNSLGEQTW